jgi:hypothetical protein
MQIHLHVNIWWERAAFHLVLLLLILGSHGLAGAVGIKSGAQCCFQQMNRWNPMGYLSWSF